MTVLSMVIGMLSPVSANIGDGFIQVRTVTTYVR
jgi:hypothetical protein